MSEEDMPDETVIRQEPDDDKTVIKGADTPAVSPQTGEEKTTVKGSRTRATPSPDANDEKTTVKGSRIEAGSAEPDDEARILRAKPPANANATILREPMGDATILRSPESGDATILREPGVGQSSPTIIRRQGDGPRPDDGPDDDSTVLRDDGDGQDDDRTVMNPNHDDDSTVMNRNTDDDATIIGDESDTTYIASLEGQQESKGNTEAGRLLKNRFVLEEKVGSGGMGDVYKALDLRQQEAQERDPYIAIKLLNESFSQHKDAFLSLQRETSRTRAIPHPNIMGVYDFDKEGDTVFMSMELLDGKPLDDYLKEHPEGVSTEDAWNILDGICLGLMRAHDAGIVHSDFKPGNIFYTKDKVAKVFDFGIARAVSNPNELEANGEKTVFDAGSLGALTPTYASYEMLKGLEPSKSDDVYAVALVAYELFMGKHPYNRVPADKAFDQGLKPKPVSHIKRRQWRALRKALALKGEERTQTVEEFHDAMFAKDPPYLIYSGVAATLVAAIGFGVYQSMQEKIKPEELVNNQSVMYTNSNNVKTQIAPATQNWQSPDWHDQLKTSLKRWKAANMIITQDPEFETWKDDWGVESAELVIADDGVDQIPEAEQKVLAMYMGKITELRDQAKQYKSNTERADVEAALALLTEADAYMTRVKADYKYIDESVVAAAGGLLEGELFYRTALKADLDEKDELAAIAAQEAADKQAAADAAAQALRDRNTEYAGYQEGLREILKCRSDIPNEELEEAARYVGQMRTKIPEQFLADTPGIITAFKGCIKRRIGYANPQRAREVKDTVLSFLPEAQEIAALKIEDKDPCNARGLVGLGSKNRECVDPLSQGGTGPQLVVIPPEDVLTGEKYAISKTEIKVGDYNQYCDDVGCEKLPGSLSIPATNLTLAQATDYMDWLTRQSGKTYRLPTVDEWFHAAKAADDSPDDNINCTVDSRGVKLGEKLKNSLSGRPNSWGLYNHVGNAREWAVQEDGSLLAMGGAHTDPKSECTLQKRVAHAGVPDPVTGFRVVRKIPPKSS